MLSFLLKIETFYTWSYVKIHNKYLKKSFTMPPGKDTYNTVCSDSNWKASDIRINCIVLVSEVMKLKIIFIKTVEYLVTGI